MKEAKTGDQLLEDFFLEIKEKYELNSDVIELLIKLFNEDKFSSNHIFNGLMELDRESGENQPNKN